MVPSLDRRKWLAAASVAFVLAATMVPTHAPDQPFSTCILCGEQGGADALANVLLFLPIGLAFGALTRRVWITVLAAAIFSTAIEITQTLAIHGRDGALGDIVFNTLGAFIGGWIITRRASRLSAGSLMQWRARAAIAAAAGAIGVVLLTGFVATPVFPRTKWFGQWTPQFGGMAYYDGRVLDARIGGRFVPSTALVDSDAVRASWIRGEPLVVTATASPPTADLSTVFSIADEYQRFMLLLGVDGPDLSFVLGRRATDARLVEPVIRIPNALLGVRPGDTLVLEARLAGRSVCLGRRPNLRCDLGLTPGTGWQFLVRVDAVRRHTAILDAIWIGALLLPAAFWFESTWMALIVAVAVCAAAPAAVGLRQSPPSEWAGALAGVAAGRILEAWTRRTRHP
jgi:VanZ family protein